MQIGPDRKPLVPPPTPEVEIDRAALEPLTANPSDPFSRYILHYGVKALAHAALAHRALEVIENPHESRSRVIEHFKIEQPPLSFSLSGLQSVGVVVPTAAMTASTLFWIDRQKTPDRVDFAHPDLLNPLIAAPVGVRRAMVPESFFQLDWSTADLLDRSKMGAALLVAERVWESCVALLRRQSANGEILVGAIDKLVLYYAGYISHLKLGDARHDSLTAGEAFLIGLVRRDEEVAASVLEQARLAALTGELDPLEGVLPPPAATNRGRRRPQVDEMASSSLTPVEQQEAINLIKLRALRDLIHDPDPANRAEGMAVLRCWQGPFSPTIEAELHRTLKQAARIERWITRLETGFQAFERGETAEGIRVIREIGSRADIPLIKEEARRLLKTFGDILTAQARSDHPTDEWPKPGVHRRLVDVVQAAYTRGSDAEVICHDGLTRSGRLCFGGTSPTVLKLLDFKHEITWDIGLTAIKSIRFFYDENPTPP